MPDATGNSKGLAGEKEALPLQPVLPNRPQAIGQEDLVRTIQTLRTELEEARAMANGPIRTKEKFVVPGDYETLKREKRALQNQNNRLRKIIENGRITILSGLIENYVEFSQDKLKAIAKEAMISDFSTEDIKELRSLVDYLESVRQEMASFIAVSEEGKLAAAPEAQRVAVDIKLILQKLGKEQQIYALPGKALAELHQIFLELLAALHELVEKYGKGDGVTEEEDAG